MTTVHERLATVEAQLDSLKTTLDATAADVRAVRDHMLVSKGHRLTLRTFGALVAGAATVVVGIQAAIAMFFPPHP